MPLNPLAKTGAPTPASEGSQAGRKGETLGDAGFAALLALALGVQVQAPVTATPEGEAEGQVLPMAAEQAPPAEAGTVRLPQAAAPRDLTSLLAEQRLWGTAAARAEEPRLPKEEAVAPGVWVVEAAPLPEYAGDSAANVLPALAQALAPALPEGEEPQTDDGPAPALRVESDLSSTLLAGAVNAAPTRMGDVAAGPDQTPAPLPSPIDPDRLMTAVARSAVTSGDGRYTVTLRLHPEHLGEVRVQLQVHGREVVTVMQVANPDARQALETRGEVLRQGLDQAGLQLTGFQVSTGQREDRQAHERWEEQGFDRRRKGTAARGVPVVGQTRIRQVMGRSPGIGFDTLA